MSSVSLYNQLGCSTRSWFHRVGEEHAAFREPVGIIDMTSFGKIEVSRAAAGPPG
jgi:glycine cleavage system aminomethyltransferase T